MAPEDVARVAKSGVSLRAEIARLGLRYFVKKSSRHETIDQARAKFQSIETLIPYPPHGTRTQRVDAYGAHADLITTPASQQGRHVLYLHGGAYRVGSPTTYRHFTWRIATAAGAHLLALDYRLAPEHPFPAALDDAVSAYLWLLANGGQAKKLAVMGDSAGGGLALALLLKLRDGGTPLPAAAVALSPWTDLALTGPSLRLNADADPMLNADDLPQFASEYLAGADPKNPYVSPLYGDPAGLPPTLFHVGSDEILRDDSVRMAEKMIDAKCAVALEIWPRMPHVWHLLAPVIPEAMAAIRKIGAFIERAFME
jgi:monoterpene epsilon-lactone hydrolase